MNTQSPPPEDMLQAVQTRDSSYDGLFYYAVTTTGVFCRPSCPARRPRPEHLAFYPTPAEALRAGYRPCARCRPLDPPADGPEWAHALIAQIAAEPEHRLTDTDLRRRGIDPAAARRYFRRTYGLTFQAYARAHRLGAALTALEAGASLDGVGYEHDWDSASGFRAAFTQAVGLPPGAARGAEHLRLTWLDTPLGPMAAAASADAVCLLEFADPRRLPAQVEALRRYRPLPLLPGESPLLDRLRAQLDEYFAGRRRDFDLPLDAPGTPFQQQVWAALQRIPYGETRHYADLARELGLPRAARAVGDANGRNRLAILLPCHRVVQANGDLGGYGGGRWRKLRLLETEDAGVATTTPLK